MAGVETRTATRGGGEVIELDLGITVYPAREKGGRWRAVWHPILSEVQWQAGDRPVPAPKVTVAGESALLVDPAEIPSSADVGSLGRALAARPLGDRDELMANLAAYSGLRWGELIALTIGQVALAARVITVDRKVVEISGHQYVETPKNRKFRRTIYPRQTPDGYPLAERLAARIGEARRAGGGHQPARPHLPLPQRRVLVVHELQPPHLAARLPCRGLAGQFRRGPVDVAQPAARVLYHGAVYLEA